MAVLVLGLVPVMSFTTDAVVEANENSVAHFADTGYSDSGGPTTTTTVPPTTTTTTTVPPTTTTTTTVPPNQTNTAAYGGEISVTFTETAGEVDYGSVVADGWTYTITQDTGTRIHLKFTNSDTGQIVVVRGFLNLSAVLKTRVVEK
jgi:hypothetical protein